MLVASPTTNHWPSIYWQWQRATWRFCGKEYHGHLFVSKADEDGETQGDNSELGSDALKNVGMLEPRETWADVSLSVAAVTNSPKISTAMTGKMSFSLHYWPHCCGTARPIFSSQDTGSRSSFFCLSRQRKRAGKRAAASAVPPRKSLCPHVT